MYVTQVGEIKEGHPGAGASSPDPEIIPEEMGFALAFQ
jgi:hypothetical protein